jgi:hypothetical protein
MKLPLVVAGVSLCVFSPALAFEVGTHARLTYEAYQRSVLSIEAKHKQLMWCCIPFAT